jgi:hypothetical protein
MRGNCILESIEIEVDDPVQDAQPQAQWAMA